MSRFQLMTTGMLFVLCTLISLSCSNSSTSPSTASASPLPTAMNTSIHPPTLAPSPPPSPMYTSIPTPDYSRAILELKDLPAGFEETPLTGVSRPFETVIGTHDFNSESSFKYMNPIASEIVLGTIISVTNSIDQQALDKALQNPDQIMETYLRGVIGWMEVISREPLDSVEKIGDSSSGLSLLTDTQGTRTRVDITAFRQDNMFAFLVDMYEEGGAPTISIQDLTRVFDQKVSEAQLPSE